MRARRPFCLEETHGILCLGANVGRASSDGYGWSSLYASAQREQPYRSSFAAVPDQLIVWHRGGPVRLAGRRGDRCFSQIVPAGSVHLIPGNAALSIDLDHELDTLHVYIRRSVIDGVAADLVQGDPRRIEILHKFLPCDRILLSLLQAVFEALDENNPGSALYIDYIAMAIAAHLIQHHSNAAPAVRDDAAPVARMLSPAVAKSIAYMREHIDLSIGVEEIAGAVNWSASQLAREFRNSTGMPPHQYLINLRISKAKELLETTDTPIAEIAFDCGFSHQEHLTRHFKRICASTPAAYRRAVKPQKTQAGRS